MIYENKDWLDDVKDLRDDFIVHHPATRHALEFHDGAAHIPLTTTKKGHDDSHIILGTANHRTSVSLRTICVLKNWQIHKKFAHRGHF